MFDQNNLKEGADKAAWKEAFLNFLFVLPTPCLLVRYYKM